MNDRIKHAVASTKEFVHDYKVAVTVTVTAAICLTINRMAVNQHDDFLKEHGLYEQFYTPEDE